MKYLALLLLLPFSAAAQSDEKKASVSGTEIAFSLGHAPDNAYRNEFRHGGYLRSGLSLLKTRGLVQYGVTLEGGTNSNDYWYLSPGAVVNRKFSRGNTYFYAGAMAGYVLSEDMLGLSDNQRMSHGYVFGLQGGYVTKIGKRLSFTSELAVRSTQIWTSYRTEFETETDVVIYFPVTIGLRYSLK